MSGMRVTRWFSASLLAALLAVGGSLPASADIPLPDRDREAAGFAERVELGPIEPLPATTVPVSRDGAGRLPRGVIVETEAAAIDPVQRQTVLVTQTILDPARQLRGVEVHRPEGQGVDTQVLEATQDTVEIDGRRVVRRHYRWAVQALRGGEVTLEFQRIDFDVVGRAQSEFAWVPVARRLAVAPLPAHLPEYLPVAPALSLRDMQVSELVAGEPGEWRILVIGEGLSEKALEQLLRAQLVAPTGLRIDEPSIRLAPDQSRAESMGPLAHVWEVRFSLLPAVTGDGDGDGARDARLPALKLPYIDPTADKPGTAIDYARSESQSVRWQAEPAEQRLAAIRAAVPWVLAGLVGLLLLGLPARAGFRWWSTRLDWRRAQQELRSATDPQALRERLSGVLAGLPQPMVSPVRSALLARGAPTDWLEARSTLERLRFAGDEADDEAFRAARETLTRSLPLGWFR
ncbi:hypothetical protein ABGV17_01545 [Guyparkeria sp. GHLCS8-2]|uniref:hypothetical protein n=1 Tax=Guyparkeria halopsychrophila TaxID=3139421 RepID=UPI0037C6F8B2